MKKSIIFFLVGIVALLIIAVGGSLIYYHTSLKPVDDKNSESISFTVSPNEAASSVIKRLAEENLIKSELTMKIYMKLNPINVQAGTYVFSKSYSVEDICKSFDEGKVTYDTFWITFVEGKRLTYIADKIEKETKFTSKEFMDTVNDKAYIKELIDRYEFLSESILDDKIYYPLEGYLFPDTYEFMSDVTIKGIIEKMLDNTAMKISKFKSSIENSKYTTHELMTLASIVELEGARSDDRKGVAGVFYNRLNSGMSLGSDVTTYYAVKKDFNVDLTWSDLASCNAYNTRGTCVKGLPAGPIATPSLASITAVMEPTKHDYLFFVADKNGKTYFSKTNSEHEAITNKLKKEGLWFTY